MAGDDDVTTTVSQPRKRRPKPEALTEEMSRRDIIRALQHLGFGGGQGLIGLDPSVRDYLMRALREQ